MVSRVDEDQGSFKNSGGVYARNFECQMGPTSIIRLISMGSKVFFLTTTAYILYIIIEKQQFIGLNDFA